MLYWMWLHIYDIVFWGLMIAFVIWILWAMWDDSRWTDTCPKCGVKRDTPRSMRRHMQSHLEVK